CCEFCWSGRLSDSSAANVAAPIAAINDETTEHRIQPRMVRSLELFPPPLRFLRPVSAAIRAYRRGPGSESGQVDQSIALAIRVRRSNNALRVCQSKLESAAARRRTRGPARQGAQVTSGLRLPEPGRL